MPNAIYLDYVSSSPVLPEIIADYQRLLTQYYANSDAIHDLGREIASLVALSRTKTAELLDVSARDLFFTSGATESNNAIIKGIAFANRSRGNHLITSSVEHSSVFETFKYLEQNHGFEVTYLDVDKFGQIDLVSLDQSIRPDTTLVSLMAINNETGAQFPVEAIVECVKGHPHTFLHVDGVQALGKYPLDLSRVDAASFSAHKIGGLKGSGLMMVKSHVAMDPLLNGGHQENGRRAGTLNALADIVFAKTLRLSLEHYAANESRIDRMHRRLIEGLDSFGVVHVNSPEHASRYILNFSVDHIPSEILLNALNQRSIYVSAQSTCSYEANTPSRVLTAMGFDRERALNSVRVSLSYLTQNQEIEVFLNALKEIIDYVKH